MVQKADYTHNIHDFQHGAFPKAKSPMEVCDHPDHEVPETEHRYGTALESMPDTPRPTDTGASKKVKYPFKGKNS